MTDTATSTDVSFVLDGKTCTAKEGETLLQAALRNGVEIPHYCWHPGLSIAGNCRMCLVFAKPGPPKPVIACSTVVREGMEVDTTSDEVKAVREGIMEFLLINHPLDCPICDQAGECDLQQYSFDHGRATSNFVDKKTQRHRKDFGPLIRYNGNRCIACTRCVRFTQEVTETHELTMANRSDHAVVDIFPGIPLDNPLSGCTADICPVGALLDKSSMHTTRTWLLRGGKSVCGGCATGCNVNVESYNDEIKRITPRENQAVNLWWMCDEGRLSHQETGSSTRLQATHVVANGETTRVPASAALSRAIAAVNGAKDGTIAGLATGHATCEELFFLKKLVGSGPVGVVYKADGKPFTAGDGFHISKDKNPNRVGVEHVLGSVDNGETVQAALTGDRVSVLIVLDAIPGGAPWDAALLEAMSKAETVIVVAYDDGPLTAAATVSFPALHWTQKDGTYVNGRGRLQRLRGAVSPPGDTRSDLEVLQELSCALGQYPRIVSAGGAFRRLAAELPKSFKDIDYNLLGDYGLPLPGATDTTPPDECSTGYQCGPKSKNLRGALDEQVRIPVHRESSVGYGTNKGDI
jgi:NADH-quinone oxidoreductase subunit G